MSTRSGIVALAAAFAATTLLAPVPAGARVVQTIGTDGPGALRYPSRVAVTPAGMLFVLESRGTPEAAHRIRTYSPAGRLLRSWLTTASASVPDLAVDAAGNAYTTSYDSGEALKYSLSGRLLTRWRAPAVPANADDRPFALGVGPRGTVVVAEGSRIEIFDTDGNLLSTVQRSQDPNNSITGVAVSGSGTIYVADQKGISSLDPSTGALRQIVGRERLRAVSPGWTVAAGPADTLYAIHPQRIQRFGPAGEYLGSVGGDRRANWLSAAIAGDGSILVPQWGSGLKAAVLRFAPITRVDETRPSIVLASFSGPSGRDRRGTRTLARLRFSLSESAEVRVGLQRRARTSSRYLHVASIDLGLVAAGSRAFVLDWRALGLGAPPGGGRYQVTLVARDDAGNESPSARVKFVVPLRWAR